MNSKIKKGLILATHNDRFHADDVFAMAVLKLYYGKNIKKVYRTRDEEIIKKADIVFDVGNIYNSKRNRFDHHQGGGAGERENGIPFASFGLVWKKFGVKICGSSKIANAIDEKLVSVIDAGDNGYSIFDLKDKNIEPYSIDRLFYIFGATWKEKENYDKAFKEVVKLAEKILEREIVYTKHKIDAIPKVKEAYKKTFDKRVLVLEKYMPFSDFVKENKQILFVIYPNKKDSFFRLNTVSDELFKNRRDLPKAWAGLVNEELEKVTGIKGAKFCHRNLFLAVGETKEVAIKLAELALKHDK